jgi:hypothetical protein
MDFHNGLLVLVGTSNKETMYDICTLDRNVHPYYVKVEECPDNSDCWLAMRCKKKGC